MEQGTVGEKPTAGFWIRAAAMIVDGLLLFFGLMILGILPAIFLPVLTTGMEKGARELLMGSFFSVLYLGVPCLYFTVCTSVWGQTLGKNVLHLKVVRLDGQAVPLSTALLRWASYFLSLIPLGFGFILGGFHREKRSLHDLVSGTKVVQMEPTETALLLMILFAAPLGSIVLGGIPAAIAIPKFAQMLERSKEGATKQNLSEIKKAASAYRKEHGKWPKDLEKDLVPKYLEAIPPVKVTGAFDANRGKDKPTGNKVTQAWAGQTPRKNDSGWLYDRTKGKLYVNSTLKDSKSIPYSYYGFE